MSDWLTQLIQQEQLPEAYRDTVETVARPLATMILERRPRLIGLCGAQGSGKSTLTQVLARLIEAEGLSIATLSLDDLYLTRAARLALARDVHPLFATRGVPATHDVALGLEVLGQLGAGGDTQLPRFDKSIDDRAASGPKVSGPVDMVLLEGWCVGAAPLPDFPQPINDLERLEDPDGIWRRASATALAGPYQALFGQIGFLVLLAAPGFEVVRSWRQEQEAKLRARAGKGMSDAEVVRFIQHYERLTRWILEEMPGRADVVVDLDAIRTAGIRPPTRR